MELNNKILSIISISVFIITIILLAISTYYINDEDNSKLAISSIVINLIVMILSFITLIYFFSEFSAEKWN